MATLFKRSDIAVRLKNICVKGGFKMQYPILKRVIAWCVEWRRLVTETWPCDSVIRWVTFQALYCNDEPNNRVTPKARGCCRAWGRTGESLSNVFKWKLTDVLRYMMAQFHCLFVCLSCAWFVSRCPHNDSNKRCMNEQLTHTVWVPVVLDSGYGSEIRFRKWCQGQRKQTHVTKQGRRNKCDYCTLLKKHKQWWTSEHLGTIQLPCCVHFKSRLCHSTSRWFKDFSSSSLFPRKFGKSCVWDRTVWRMWCEMCPAVAVQMQTGNMGCLAEECVFFLACGQKMSGCPPLLGLPWINRPPVFGCQSCCLEIGLVDVDRGHTGNIISCPPYTLQEVKRML